MTGIEGGGPAWVFTRTANLTWEWARPDGARSRSLFPTLDAATVNAARHGFDPLKCYWVAVVGERTTHYRPAFGPSELSGAAGEREGGAVDDVSLDWAYRMAATIVINLTHDHPQLNRLGAIKVAWGALKDSHPHHKDRFDSVAYVAETVRAIRDIGEQRKRPMPHPDAEDLARSRLRLPQRVPRK